MGSGGGGGPDGAPGATTVMEVVVCPINMSFLSSSSGTEATGATDKLLPTQVEKWICAGQGVGCSCHKKPRPGKRPSGSLCPGVTGHGRGPEAGPPLWDLRTAPWADTLPAQPPFPVPLLHRGRPEWALESARTRGKFRFCS